MSMHPYPDSKNIYRLAQTLYGEARGESYKGKVAVGWVIRNRVENGPSWMLQNGRRTMVNATNPSQFECWQTGNPNMNAIQRVSKETMEPYKEIAQDIVDGEESDPTYGSQHYHAVTNQLTGNRHHEDWARGKTPVARIGNHVFYNDI